MNNLIKSDAEIKAAARAPYPASWGTKLHGVLSGRGALVVLYLSIAALAVPTLVENIRQNWSLDQNAQGPIILGIGLWLLFRRWPAMQAVSAPRIGAFASGLAFTLWLADSAVYVVGRVGGEYLLESYALYGFLLIGVYATLGARSLRAGGFPLVYLVFALPVPTFLSHALTTHLRLWITQAIVEFFQMFGLVIVKDGLTLMVDQYQLSVEDACSGMNSLFSLSEIGLVYVYLKRPGNFLYYGLMLTPIVGFAVFSNFVRVAIVVLMTHCLGDALAQSLLHEVIGFITFGVALGGVIAADALAGPWLAKPNSKAKTSGGAPLSDTFHMVAVPPRTGR